MNVWTDGNNIYLSSNDTQYVLDKSTSTWSPKKWTYKTDPNYTNYTDTNYTFGSGALYSDGTNIYLINPYSNVKYLNKETSTWIEIANSSNSNANAYNMWSDGTNIYYSADSIQYVLTRKTIQTTRTTVEELSSETWTFTMADGTVVTKTVFVKS